MDVKITRVLEEQMRSDELDPQEFIQAFSEWKSSDEYSSYLFGKDASYARPSILGMPQAFRHVHLVPLTDTSQLTKWNKSWARKNRKTSDRALVYGDAGSSRYLLIYILSEPDAHAIAGMKTLQHKELMERFIQIAEVYVGTGSIIQ